MLTGNTQLKYLVLGAGPAGLAFANALKQHGEHSFLVLEKENRAGGLCRSKMIGNTPVDTGGGHFLDTRSPAVLDFLFPFMPQSQWRQFQRISKIDLYGHLVDHPLEANIWQLPSEIQKRYLASIDQAGCNSGQTMPVLFTDWIKWKLGERIADDYMLPYNTKLFGKDLNELGTYWLNKLPDVSYSDTLQSCVLKKAIARQPGHASFFYPLQHGYGQLWLSMAQAIKEHIRYNSKIVALDCNKGRVTTQNGDIFSARHIIFTIPWRSVEHFDNMPEGMRDKINRLKHTGVRIEYFAQNIASDAHWIYCPQPDLPFHRQLLIPNFFEGAAGHWTETNSVRSAQINADAVFENPYAYPLNTVDKPEIMSELLAWTARLKIYGLGRWGEHQHYNSDVTVERALQLCNSLMQENT